MTLSMNIEGFSVSMQTFKKREMKAGLGAYALLPEFIEKFNFNHPE